MRNTNYKLLHNCRLKSAIEGLWMRIEVRLRLSAARSLAGWRAIQSVRTYSHSHREGVLVITML